jgi:hypothetical protein
MTSSIDRTTAFAAATALAAGALGAAAYFYTTGSAVTDEQSSETKALYEKWRAGPWFVRPEDVKGTAKVTELRIHPLKVSPRPAALSYCDDIEDRVVKISQSKNSTTPRWAFRCDLT